MYGLPSSIAFGYSSTIYSRDQPNTAPPTITDFPVGNPATTVAPVRIGVSSASALGRVDDFRFTNIARYSAAVISLDSRRFPRS